MNITFLFVQIWPNPHCIAEIRAIVTLAIEEFKGTIILQKNSSKYKEVKNDASSEN
jgi:hypothetical protein